MKASELRIGNLVYYHDEHLQPDNKVIKVSVDDLKILFHNEKYHHYEPITLTEEWLVRFGFKNGGYDLLFWNKEGKKGVFSINGYNDIGFGVRYNNEIDVDIEYVYQLQNLYFAITGEELTIK